MADVHSLVPHPKNPNKHPDDQIERLAKILTYQGFRYPIKISKQTGYITSGHGRLMAAKKLNMDAVPVVYQNYETADQELADLTADNSIASWADLDLAAVNNLIEDLGPDFDMEWLGVKNFTVDPWESDIEAMEKLGETDEAAPQFIKITCSKDLYDEVLIYIKAKLLETSFVGVHVE
jgi:hypothetical protein